MVKIYLSASTQHNKVAGSYGTEEQNMHILRDRTEYFIKNGGHGDKFTVYKNSNKAWTLTQIVNDSNAKNVKSHWAFHSNAGSTSGRGCEVYYYYKTQPGTGDKMAELWYKEISAVTPTADRGVKKDSVLYSNGLYETRETKAPAALCEHFFHSNQNDVTFYLANVDLFAMASAIAIYKYHGYTFTKPSNLKSYEQILKEVSNYSAVWVDFVKKHPEVNLKGLIQLLYYKQGK